MSFLLGLAIFRGYVKFQGCSFHHTQPFLIAKRGSLKEHTNRRVSKNGFRFTSGKILLHIKHLFFASPLEHSGNSLNMANSSLEREVAKVALAV